MMPPLYCFARWKTLHMTFRKRLVHSKWKISKNVWDEKFCTWLSHNKLEKRATISNNVFQVHNFFHFHFFKHKFCYSIGNDRKPNAWVRNVASLICIGIKYNTSKCFLKLATSVGELWMGNGIKGPKQVLLISAP